LLEKLYRLYDKYVELLGDFREQITYLYAFLFWQIALPFTVLIHETGHAIVGTACGLHIDAFVWGGQGGYVSFAESGYTQYLPQVSVVMIFLAGGLFEIGFYLLLSRVFWKSFETLAVGSVGYTIWEGGRGFLLTCSHLPIGLYSTYSAWCQPILTISFVVMIVFTQWRLKQIEDRVLKKFKEELWAEYYMR
jgi:hypothetical protein